MTYTEAIAHIDKLLEQYGETAPEWLRVVRMACIKCQLTETIEKIERWKARKGLIE